MCSIICNEKKKRNSKVDAIKTPPEVFIAICFLMLSVIFYTIIALLNKAGLLSDEKFFKLDPFEEQPDWS